MLYALKIATRYLTANKAQTALLVFGVAIGVFIFIFMSRADRRPGRIHHVAHGGRHGPYHHRGRERRIPRLLICCPKGTSLLVQRRRRAAHGALDDAAAFMPLIEALPGVTGTSQQINGAGFLTRGAQVTQVSSQRAGAGTRVRDRSTLTSYIAEGTADLRRGRSLLGKTLADDMDLPLGQTVRLQSSNRDRRALTITGIYEIGSGGPDRRQAYVSLATARTLFAMPQGVTRIEIKLADLYAADATAAADQGADRAGREVLDGTGGAAARGAEGAGADRLLSSRPSRC